MALVDRDGHHIQLKTRVLLKGIPVQAKILAERYDADTEVYWTPKGVINGETMLKMMKSITEEVNSKIDRAVTPGKVGIVILDSARAHLTEAVRTYLATQNVDVVTIPGGCTSIVQWVDVFFAALYKRHHQEEFDRQPSKHRTSAEKRALLSQLVASATQQAIKKLHVSDNFTKLGYFDPRQCDLRTLSTYRFKVFCFLYIYSIIAPPPALQVPDFAANESQKKLEHRLAAAKKAAKQRPKSLLEMWRVQPPLQGPSAEMHNE